MSGTALPRLTVRETDGLRNGPLWATIAVVLGLAVLAWASHVVNGERPAFAGAAIAAPGGRELAPPPPESDPNALVQLSAQDALARNAAIPVTDGANPPASAFRLTQSEVDRMRSIDCLTAAIYYEAGLEPADGQRAVAQVILNRVRHPFYPNTVCGVVFQGHQRVTGCQFTFTCDGSLRRTPVPALWNRARAIAEAALGGYVHRPVGWATHYHANYVLPYWAPTLAKVATIGTHIFYRWDGGFARGRNALRYAGGEPNIVWRGGFGQPGRNAVTTVAGGAVDERDAAAAAAAAEARQNEPSHSVDSFQRAVLRRYEVTTPQRARELNAQQVQGANPSQRWGFTGEGGREQSPLGRPNQPRELEGVRRRPGTAQPAPAQPQPGNSVEAR
jgi:spore germination cell wall hydrolase CwlJ-like protein